VSIQSDFSIRENLGIDPPCYVRKVDRRSHCGNEDQPPEVRAALIKKYVLSEDGGVTSVFLVNDARDVARAALALNFCRTGGSRVEELCLVAFRPDELADAPMEQTADSFGCHWAQLNHWNVTLIDVDQERIANLLAIQNRFAHSSIRKRWRKLRLRQEMTVAVL